MPTVSLPAERVKELLGEELSDEQVAELCFAFGLELDGRVQEEGKDVLRIDVPANRYDLLSAEGLGSSLYRFSHKDTPQRHPRIVIPKEGPHTLVVDPSVNKVRSYVVAAVIRNAHINVPSFIDCQDKLNINLGRRRQLVSIGTHELKKVNFPVTYIAKNPDDIHFLPLKAVKEYPEGVVPSGRQVVEDLSHHQQLREYVGLLEGQEVYPIIQNGGNNEVLSMPPLVNSDYSKHDYTYGGHHGEEENQLMDVFIDITATDLTRAHMTLDILLYSFATGEGSWVEPVKVVYKEPTEFALKHIPHGEHEGECVDTCPRLRWNAFGMSMNNLKRLLGIELKPEFVSNALEKMGMLVVSGKNTVYKCADFCIAGNKLVNCAENKEDCEKPCDIVECEYQEGELLTVFVPPYRSDVLHEVDLIEDVAIGYGYDKIYEYQAGLLEHRVDAITSDETSLLLRTKLTEFLRHTLVSAGYTEILTFSLNNKVHEYMGEKTPENNKLFNDEVSCFFNPGVSNIPLLNPKSTHFTHLRSSLITGLMKAVKHNTSRPKPLQFFEIGDVACVSPKDARVADTNANPRIQQRLHCAIIRCAQADGFEYVKGIVDLIECKLVPKGKHLKLVEHNIPVFAERRSALVICEDEEGKQQICGVIGVVSPVALSNAKITFPVSYAEIDIQLFM